MSEEPIATTTVREAVGVFHDRDSFQGAVDALLTGGFDRSALSLLASQRAIEDKLGGDYERVADLEDDPTVPKTAFVGRDSLVEAKTGAIGGLAYVGALAAVGAVVASGGSLGMAIAAAVAAGGGGGLLGTLIARHLGRDLAHSMSNQMERGGLLLWVRVVGDDQATRAEALLRQHGGEDVHIHDLTVPATPEKDPLAGFEPDPFLPQAKV